MGGGILGVGPAELVVIVILMLVVAGPKRMIAWAYYAGKYMSVMRGMFQETMDAFQRELNAAGLDKELAKNLSDLNPGRFDVVNEASKVINTDLAGPTTTSAPQAPAATTPTADTKSDDDKSGYDAWRPS